MEELAKDYICIEFPEAEDVLKAAQHMMSKEITHEPTIKQQFKDLYNCYTVLYTKPTTIKENMNRLVSFIQRYQTCL